MVGSLRTERCLGKVLFDTAFFNSAKAYVLYREQHAQIMAITAMASANLVDSYLNKLDWKEFIQCRA